MLKQDTKEMVMVSEKTGNEYTTEVVPKLRSISIEEIDGKYKHSVVDTVNDPEYITAKIAYQYRVASPPLTYKIIFYSDSHSLYIILLYNYIITNRIMNDINVENCITFI